MNNEELLQLFDRSKKANARTLNLSGMDLAEIPSEIGQITTLEEIRLDHNRLSNLPMSIRELPYLRVLRLQGNSFGTFPRGMMQFFDSLETIYLDPGNRIEPKCEIVEVDKAISQLLSFADKKSPSVVLQNSGLRRLPTDICKKLKSLRHLDLSWNQLKEIPSSISELTKLQTLRLSGNRISQLPEELCDLENLREIHVDSNELLTLPERIGALSKLQMLQLRKNKIQTLPKSLADLRLHELDLSEVQLEEVPKSVFRINGLRRLNLCMNQIAQIPDDCALAANLESLDLSQNRIRSLPPSIGKLIRLRSLNLSNNFLAELPVEIAGLVSLGSLDVSANRDLRSFPDALGALRGIYRLTASSSYLDDPLPELMKRGTDALLAYLRSLSESEEQFEAKMLLVGEGNVGKTSLVGRLQGESFIPDRDTTHGIEIGKLEFPIGDSDHRLVLNTWDFGGQE
ncbi:MAG: leucine-rich repeat domain-containing protein, partial [Planctomycetota bacterium]